MVQNSLSFFKRLPILAISGMVSLCLTGGGLLQAQAATSDQDIPSALELYHNHIENNGGRVNIQALSSLIINGEVITSSGKAQTFKIVRKRPNLFRMKTESEDTIFNGKQGWKIEFNRAGEKEVTALEGEALAALERVSDIEGPFVQLAGQYEKMRPVAIEDVLAQPAVRLEIDPSAGCAYHTIWLSMEHFQEVKLARTVTPSGAELPYEEAIYLSDFKKVEGINYSKKADYYRDGSHTKTVLIERIQANVGIFNSYFKVN